MLCPKCSSKAYAHRLKKGQDGTMWRSTKMSNGKFRWQRTAPSLTKRRSEKITKKIAGTCGCQSFKTWKLPLNTPVFVSDHQCVGVIKYSDNEFDTRHSNGLPTIVIQKQLKASAGLESIEDGDKKLEAFMELHDYEYEATTMRNTLGHFLEKCDPEGKCIARWTPCSLANAVDQDENAFPPDTVLILTAFELESKKGRLTGQHKQMGFKTV